MSNFNDRDRFDLSFVFLIIINYLPEHLSLKKSQVIAKKIYIYK